MNEELPLISAIKSSFRPEVISNIKDYDDETKVATCGAYQLFLDSYKNASKVWNLKESLRDNPSMTVQDKTLHVADNAAKHFDTAVGRFNSCTTDLKNSIAHFEKTLSEPLSDVTANVSQAIRMSDICKHVANLSTKDRNTFLNDAIQRNDQLSLRAVLGGPSFLSGLKPEEMKHYTNLYRKTANPLTSAQLNVATECLRLVENRAGMLTDFFEGAMGTSLRDVQKIRAAKALADKALKAAT